MSVRQSAGASWAVSQALLKHQRRAAVSFGLFAYSKTRARMSELCIAVMVALLVRELLILAFFVRVAAF